MGANSLAGVQPPIVEGSTSSVIELVATRGKEIVVDPVFVSVSFTTP